MDLACNKYVGFWPWADSAPRAVWTVQWFSCYQCADNCDKLRRTGHGTSSMETEILYMFPETWEVRQWFASTATYDEQRRFLRTLAPVGLISHLKSKRYPSRWSPRYGNKSIVSGSLSGSMRSHCWPQGPGKVAPIQRPQGQKQSVGAASDTQLSEVH